MKKSTWMILGILALAVYAAVKFAPPYIRNFQFKMLLNSSAEDSGDLNNEEIIHDIKNKIEELSLPFEPKHIYPKPPLVEPEGPPFIILDRGEGYFTIDAEYQITIELFFGKIPVTLTFSPSGYYEPGT